MTGGVTLYHGDCLDILPTLAENSVDTIITDPPYGLSFMGKSWDHGVPGVAFWEATLRVAKPGAIMMAFGGTRTWHRLAVAIEDAGWEIRDCMMWLYGSGFPKSLDISKAIDGAAGAEREVVGRKSDPRYAYSFPESSRPYQGVTKHNWMLDESIDSMANITAPATALARQWHGWGTALKPAWEPIIVAMKPTDGTFAANAERWGVAGLWIDGGRVPGANGDGVWGSDQRGSKSIFAGIGGGAVRTEPSPFGRWPANLILDETAAAMLDAQSGESVSSGGGGMRRVGNGMVYGNYRQRQTAKNVGKGDSGGASRFFYCAKASRAERNAGLDGMETTVGHAAYGEYAGTPQHVGNDGTPQQNHHPTVKPVALLEYLCTLTKTPTGGVVLDPFMGSGTTGIAAVKIGRSFIGIELEADYHEIARRRIEHARAQMPLPMGVV